MSLQLTSGSGEQTFYEAALRLNQEAKILPLLSYSYCIMDISNFYGTYPFAVPQLGYFAAGVFLPALLSLYYDTRLPLHLCSRFLLIGSFLLLPAFALTAEMFLLLIFRELPFSVMQLFLRFFQFDSGRGLLLKISPLCSGVLLFLGCNQKK